MPDCPDPHYQRALWALAGGGHRLQLLLVGGACTCALPKMITARGYEVRLADRIGTAP